MPIHKGIQMSIVSQWELKLHPEFPHPDSTQFTNRDLRCSVLTSPDVKPSALPESKSDKLLGRQPSVSVYIPSLSGARFWIRYNVVEAAAVHSPWYYFKLFINGRHITSWGTNAKTKPHGQVMKGMFDPSDRWNYKQEGVVYKNMGTESRPFFFNNEAREQSAATDGGLIEVRVFRARGRQRTMPKPTEYKPQDEYGIVMPSGGLVDKPQDARFYDWHLRDPIDNPFATFKFHYRSWENLISLQLIPADHPRHFIQSPSILSLNGMSVELQQKLEERECLVTDDMTQKQNYDPIMLESISFESSTTPLSTSVFDNSIDIVEELVERSFPLISSKMHCPEHLLGKVPISKFAQTAKPLIDCSNLRWKGQINRPLPEIPPRDPSLQPLRPTSPAGTSVVNHSRNPSVGSAMSGAPSVTPSLLPYLERNVNSPEPVLGIAALIPVPRSGSNNATASPVGETELDLSEEDSKGSSSTSSKEGVVKSSPSTLRKRRGMTSPPLGGLFSLSNITLRKKRKSPFKISPTTKSEDLQETFDTSTDKEDSDQGNLTNISITESEWMCRTPSPIRNDPGRARVESLWSPSPGQRSSKDGSRTSSGGLRRKAMEWYENVRSSASPDDSRNGQKVSGSGFRIRSGNWI